MSLFFYGVFILGMVVGGLLLLLLFSLLAIAKRGDESLDQRESEMHQTRKYASPFRQRAKSENLGVPATSDLYHGGTT